MLGYNTNLENILIEIIPINFSKFKNTVPKDLWDALQEKADNKRYLPVTLATIMQNWTEKAGYPVVNVNLIGKDVVLSQERFFFHKAKGPKSKYKWYIPISFTTDFEKQFNRTYARIWLTPNDNFVRIRNAIENEMSWIVINIQSTAFIRVNYHESLWRALEEALKKPGFDKIHVLNRAQIISDATNLARAGALSYEIALNILLYLKTETEYYPWYSAFDAFDYLFLRFNSGTEMTKLLNTHVLNLMQKLYRSVTIERFEPNHINTLKKVLTLRWACKLGHEESINNAMESFYSFRYNTIRIDPDYRSIVHCTTIRNSNDSQNWLYLRRRLAKTQQASEISLILNALGCTKDENLLYMYLKETIDPTSGIRPQDYTRVFLSVLSGNQEGIPVGLQFLKNNLQAIINNYGSLRNVVTILKALANRLTSRTLSKDFKAFIAENEELLEDISHATQSAIEACDENLEWVEKHSGELTRYLKENVYIETKVTEEIKSQRIQRLKSSSVKDLGVPTAKITTKSHVEMETLKSNIAHITPCNTLVVIIIMFNW
ncbi:hypothetical protein ILUMI_09379 [Ignelater luminosus]|uniref:Aminopeptidase N n=1 Tax=Ignelater luminosus TaxID=2038154 RepID=A0A8K0CZW0_IGNLU|nr:hypothetical protein ILUMI_09379 [Ignelater luminosus]